MSEEAELAGELLGDDRSFDPEGDGGRMPSDAKGDVTKYFDNWKEKMPDNLKGKIGGLEIDPETKHLQIEIDGEMRDYTSAQNKFSQGDIEGAYKDLGINVEDPAVKDAIKVEKVAFDASPSGEFKNAVENAKAEAVKAPDPADADQARQQAKDNGLEEKYAKLEADFKDLKDKMAKMSPEDAKAEAESWWERNGGKIKLAAGILALILISASLYEFITHAQNALNGCWKGATCKISALTCKDDAIKPHQGWGSSDFSLCNPCTNTSCTDTDGWIPAKRAEFCACDVKDTAPFRNYDYTKSTGKNSCGGKNPSCPVGTAPPTPKNYVENYDEDTASCPYASGCISRSEACQNTQGNNYCSSWCNADVLFDPTIHCVNLTWWEAAAATVPDLVPSNILNWVEKVLIYCAIGIVALVVLYWIGKELFSAGSRALFSESNESHIQNYPHHSENHEVEMQTILPRSKGGDDWGE